MTHRSVDYESLDYERRPIDVPAVAISAAAAALQELGLSVSWGSDQQLSTLVRWGSQGAYDRAVLLGIEIRFSQNLLEQVQWLEMCWQLPAAHPALMLC